MQDIDDYLMLQFLDGDRNAFTQLVNRHKESIFQFILYKTKDRELALDLAQDVFIKLFNSASGYNAYGKFKSWLFRIAQNVCIDNYRKRPKAEILSLDRKMISNSSDINERLEDQSTNPVSELEHLELQTIINQAVNTLPEKQRTALVLCQNYGMRYAEIATIQNCPVGTVKSRIHAAVTTIKEILVEKGMI